MCSHHTPFGLYDLRSNVQYWLICGVISALAINLNSFNDPIDILIFGTSIGAMFVWAQQIGYEWLKGKHVRETKGEDK